MRISSDSLETFEQEIYSCRDCRVDIPKSKVNKDTWCCDYCGEKVIIDIGKRHNLARLYPHEMNNFDMVYDQYSEKFYGIKGINNKEEKSIIGVEGYRGITVREDELVNCMWVIR
ncbi:hypothetical protein MKY15_20525 [Sporosarcina sp. FSL K6-1540]|uniref:hypothetical protein n=1 Tax=Sporosarcina sp. FSL K6-1540 TaxID=2921555 RepID=UPI00315AC21D